MKRTIRLNESELKRLIAESIRRTLSETRFMSDEDIASQYDGMKITHFTLNPLVRSDGWGGTFELVFPNADGVDYGETMVNEFIVYDTEGKRIAWEHWMPDEQTRYLENIIRQEITKRNR